ncbi:MAG TPA: AlpA family phage regulatory protein [Nitrospina sp.]|nr:AlpA family phage regulatory protein [Nitrospina sp.]
MSKVTIWRMEKSGAFPKRINLTNRRVGWIESEILDWLESRPKGICAEPVMQID